MRYVVTIGVFIVVSVLFVIPVLGNENRQTIDQSEPQLFNQFEPISGASSSAIYREVGSGEIRIRHFDTSGNIVADDIASGDVLAAYLTFADDVEIERRESTLKTVNGSRWQDWVGNRSDELSQCETDMLSLLDLDFSLLGNNAQNQVIHGIAECIEVNARVNRKTISALVDLLIARGIITP